MALVGSIDEIGDMTGFLILAMGVAVAVIEGC